MPTNWLHVSGGARAGRAGGGGPYLLEEHEACAHVGSPPAALLEAVCPLGELELELGDAGLVHEGGMALGQGALLELGLGDDLEPLALDARVGRGQGPQLGQVPQRILLAALGGEPARREGQEDGAEAEGQAGDDLDEEGQLPRPVGRDVLGPVGDPEGNDDAKHDAEFFQDEQGAADLRGRYLGDVEGDDHAQPCSRPG